MSIDCIKAPFPWFGGKVDAAPDVWAALGDVEHYTEPFAGSLAVLLRRPHPCNRTYYSETVNDLDGLLANAWRSIQLSPDALADAASYPVAECDLHARHLALVRWRSERQLEHLMGDPAWHDPVMGGWWLWGQSAWIGSGWCSGRGSWVVGDDGRITKGPNGVKRQLPHLTDNGQGVNRPQLREPGVGEYHPMTMPELRRWMQFLSARLRHVRILNGDWKRAVTGGATRSLSVRHGGTCGIFVDPPYSADAKRDNELYASEDIDVAHAVREWARERGKDADTRIVLAGFDGEHESLAADGWRAVEWFRTGFLKGGMAQQGARDDDGETTSQQHRERLWLSPHCLGAEPVRQGSLFGGRS